MNLTDLPGNHHLLTSPRWRWALACLAALVVLLSLSCLTHGRTATDEMPVAAADRAIAYSSVGAIAAQADLADGSQAALYPPPPVEIALSVTTESEPEPDTGAGPPEHARSSSCVAGLHARLRIGQGPRPLRFAHPSQGPPALA